MNTQKRIFFSSLALALAAGVYGGAQAQQTQRSSPQMPPPSAQSQSPGASGGSTGQQGSAQTQSQSPTTTTTQSDNPILNMKAGEISGRQVYNTEGKELGKVDMIGRDRVTGDLNAILSVGGFLGFGGSKVAIPIDQLALQNNKLVLSTAMTKKELRQQSSTYQSKHYESLADDTTLSQVAPASVAGSASGSGWSAEGGSTASGQPQTAPLPSTAGQASFQSLDANKDGFISRDEASKNQALMSQWRVLDRNRDDRIDSSEFSAFEAAGDSQSGGANGGAQSQQPAPRNGRGERPTR